MVVRQRNAHRVFADGRTEQFILTVLLIVAYFRFVFGWLSRNMERQADLFALALKRMGEWSGVHVLAASGLYRTEPQGDADQPWFLNQAASLACESGITAEMFLDALLQLEQELGRVRDGARRFGPRIIDLDLLLFGDIVSTGERVCLPHPRMATRAFVLVPLLEIAPSLCLPGGGPLTACLEKLRYRVVERTIFQESNHHGKST